ncbi:MAG: hypothetical protein WBE52_20500, partial [Terriglobales bacterium]
MNHLPETLESRKAECADIVLGLLSAASFAVDVNLRAQMPVTSGGLYLIARKNNAIGQYLWAGKTKDLRRRVCSDHCSGGGDRARSDLIQKVIDKGLADTRQGAQSWIRTNCTVQWIPVADPDLRGWA